MTNISELKSYITLTRPINFIITFFVVIFGALFCAAEEYSLYIILLAAISAALTAASGNVVNDIYDKESDKINHPERPLAKGIISDKEAWAAYFVLTLAAIFLSAFINQIAFAIVVFTSVLLYLYSIRLKRIPLLGNITIAYLTGLAFIYGGVAVNNVSDAYLPAVFAFMINLIRELVKDIQDMEGDKKVGLKTFPIKLGTKATNILITSLTVTLIIFTFYPFVNQIYKIEFFVTVMIIVNPLLVYFIKLLYEDNHYKNLNKLSNMLKLNMVLGLLAIILGK
ncbi:MAG: geranylgeranylglycerol-phosphate geranylgeranyltransferase [Ignavibacterium sp.]|nr:MAG: geranylgeranylglycerol-phosphate geranylgeranyltransferase [Ignavibacterium sp.]